MSIPKSFIQDIIAKTDIVEIVQPRVPLKKRGDNFTACCPFHQEKSPSFTVSYSKQFYYCFGCGAHGNAIGFLMAFDRMEFVEAVQHLADQLGVDVPNEQNTREDYATTALYPLLEQVAHFYQQALRETKPAIDYLKRRGLTGQTAKHFRLGFAPSDTASLLQTLKPDATSRQRLVQAGVLVQRDDQSVYDRFRQRVIFPIRDVRGRVIAFGGRSLGDQQPKYLNSPETPVFHKSNELYGLFEAKQAGVHQEQLIIVEGYMDVVSLHQHGIANAVATLGTATNIKHLQKLLRYCSDIVFCFDGDRAGNQAAWKALTMSLPILRDGINIRFLFLPEGEDPDTMVQQEGKARFLERVRDALPLSEVLFNQLRQQQPLRSLDDKAAFAKTALALIGTMPNGVFQQLLTQRLASILEIAPHDLGNLSQRQPGKPSPQNARPAARATYKPNQQLTLAQHATALLLQAPALCQQPHDLSTLMQIDNPDLPLLIKVWQILSKEPTLEVGQLLDRIEDIDEKSQIAELAARPLNIPETGYLAQFKDTVTRLAMLHFDQKAQRLIAKARQAPLTEAERQQQQQALQKKHELQGILAENAEKLAN